MVDDAMWHSRDTEVPPSWQAAPIEPAHQPVPSAPGGGSIVGELRNLAELYAAGALTDAEYATAKVRLLN